MIKQAEDERRVLRLALDISHQATRHKRANDERDDLIFDLEQIEEKAEELWQIVSKWDGGEPTTPT